MCKRRLGLGAEDVLKRGAGTCSMGACYGEFMDWTAAMALVASVKILGGVLM